MKYFILGLISAILLLLLAIIFFPNHSITNPADYDHYLQTELLNEARKESDHQITFWEKKLNQSPDNHIFQKKMAALLTARFKLTGEIGYLLQSDSLYKLVNQRFPEDVGVLHGLTANSITKHAFKDAEDYIQRAYKVGEKKFASSLLMTDVYLERGDLNIATKKLKDISTKQHFDYLIRLVKWYDQKGNLDQAVKSMERALSLARSSNNKMLINWSLSNLADMYGHQGKIAQSYSTYLEALRYKPTDLHALKGIAWIVYSHEKNTEEAKRILSFLKSVHPLPDYDLILAEIAAFEGDHRLEKYYIDQFVAKASQPIYGNMYNAYLCAIYGEDKNKIAAALRMAELEIEERPHPVNYSLMAWIAHLNGENEKALSLIENFVVGQTEEPDALYRAGIIYKSNNKHKTANKYLSEAKAAAFELGPVAMRELDKL